MTRLLCKSCGKRTLHTVTLHSDSKNEPSSAECDKCGKVREYVGAVLFKKPAYVPVSDNSK
jgi:uncharacterized Zn finger protein